MKLDSELLVNQFAQDVKSEADILEYYNSLDLGGKEDFFEGLIYLIIQSKVTIEDIDFAIKDSKLKNTLTPCNMIRKGVNESNLRRLKDLRGKEEIQSIILLLSLFRIGYLRRFNEERNDVNKWWYWDLSDPANIRKIVN